MLPFYFGNNIDVVQSIVCHVKRSEPKGSASALREILAFPLRASDLKVHCVQDDKNLWVNCYIIA